MTGMDDRFAAALAAALKYQRRGWGQEALPSGYVVPSRTPASVDPGIVAALAALSDDELFELRDAAKSLSWAAKIQGEHRARQKVAARKEAAKVPEFDRDADPSVQARAIYAELRRSGRGDYALRTDDESAVLSAVRRLAKADRLTVSTRLASMPRSHNPLFGRPRQRSIELIGEDGLVAQPDRKG